VASHVLHASPGGGRWTDATDVGIAAVSLQLGHPDVGGLKAFWP
jgi:hypothetical protein